jgi:hypothetical protein
MNALRILLTMLSTCVLAGALTGCDPKLTGTEGEGDGGGGGDDGPPQITPEVRNVGMMVALHLDIIRASLSKSGDFETIPPASSRSIFTSDCIEFATRTDGWDVWLTDCVDGNGTSYRGGGALFPIDTQGFDGYYFWPFGQVEDTIIATNPTTPSYAHVYSQGNLQFLYVRNGGSGEVTAVQTTNWIIHRVGDLSASFTWDAEFSGGIGSHDAYPAPGGTLMISGDYLSPPFEVQFGGSSVGTFNVYGWEFTINLDTGEIQLAPV